MTPRIKARLVTTMLAASVAALAGCAARPPRAYRVVPLQGPSYTIQEGVVAISAATFRMTILPLDDLARGAFIRARAEGATDPFGPDHGGTPRYITFRLMIQNTGDTEPVVFQPQNIYLASSAGDRLFPLDFPQAYSRFAGSVNNDPRMLEDLAKYLFDVGVSVLPGGRVEGLLVYPAGRIEAKKLRMEFNFQQTGSSASPSYDIYFIKEPLS